MPVRKEPFLFQKEACVAEDSVNDARRLAAEIGLQDPAPAVLEQLPLAAATARRHGSALKAIDLAPHDEPAVVFALPEARSR